jgi:hypothetical protein
MIFIRARFFTDIIFIAALLSAAGASGSNIKQITSGGEVLSPSITDRAPEILRLPSTDTKIFTVHVGDSSYKIPRNYIREIIGDIIVIRVTYPGFRPLTEETRSCLEKKKPSSQSSVCIPLDFRIRGPGARTGLGFSRAQMLENILRHNPDVRPRQDSAGYSIYDLGPDNARIEEFKREKDDLYFHCIVGNIEEPKSAVCDDSLSLFDGNIAKFFFPYDLKNNVADIELGIRQLMKTLSTEGG